MIMKKIRLLLTAIIALASLTASAEVNLKISKSEIESTVRNQPQKLKSLTDRFASGDSTLSREEVATVYFGTAMMPGFNPGAKYTDVENAYSASNFEEALRLIDNALASDPPNLALPFKRYGAASGLGKADRAAGFQKRLLGICEVIFGSGMGVSDASPYIVARPSDRDEFIAKYLQPVKITGSATLGDIDAVKMKLDGVKDEVILYFKPLAGAK